MLVLLPILARPVLSATHHVVSILTSGTAGRPGKEDRVMEDGMVGSLIVKSLNSSWRREECVPKLLAVHSHSSLAGGTVLDPISFTGTSLSSVHI